jgi:circadian clock protein KaiB
MKTRKSRVAKGEGSRCEMRLDIPGKTSPSLVALHNLHKFRDAHPECNYPAEVIELLKNPKLPASDQVLAGPVLLRKLPPPLKKFIGDLTDGRRALVGLGLRPRELRL